MKKNVGIIVCFVIAVILIVCLVIENEKEKPAGQQTKESVTETTTEKSATEEPTTEEPATEEPTTEEPTTEKQTEKETVKEQTYTEEELAAITKKIEELKVIFPADTYWNHKNGEKYEYYAVTDKPCDHKDESDIDYDMKCNVYKGITNSVFPYSVRGAQCLGFASLCSDYIFGTDTPAWAFYDYDKVQVGDQARISNDTHSVLIIEKTDEYIIVAECNADYRTCKIAWGRKIKRSKLEKAWYIRRGENPEQ